MKRFLVALDGSRHGEAALALALRWARRFEASLAGLAVVDEPSIHRHEIVPIGATHFKQHLEQQRLREARERAEGILDDFRRRCEAEGVPFATLEDVGASHEQILREAPRFDALLLGRETHFRSPPDADDTLLRVLRQTPRPLVAVPETPPESESVLVAYDGSLQAARALQSFCGLYRPDRHPIDVLSVHPDPYRAAEWTSTAAEFLEAHGLRTVTRPVVSSARPEDVILDSARDLGAGLVVMGALGRPRLREFLIGSVTRSMLRRSPVPLFLDR